MPNIAILMGRWTSQNYEVVRGVFDFAQSQTDWNLQTFEEARPVAIRSAQVWQAGAAICILEPDGPANLDELAAIHVPVVLVGQQVPTACPLPSTTPNVSSYGQLIIQHLQNIAFERVLWVTQTPNLKISANLEALFDGKYSELTLRLSLSELRATQPAGAEELVRWLGERERVSVVIAGDDEVALYVKRVASRLGCRIPQHLSIISLRDGLSLGLPGGSITSVVQPNHELGYQAARIIQRVLAGHPAPSEPVVVDALHLTCRASSVESRQDLAIERAIKYINENATRGITVSEVMTFQQTSRVTFERQFQAMMGCTPGDYIRQIKVKKACELLAQSSQTVEAIGKTCGYHSPAKFSSFFKRAMGVSPAAYRRQHQT